ncbi:hypothetical protein BGZ81_002466 [Podila clonocystis]|nr:hypothetical protein BGZ81_002466 [Podila clonocystis]
MEDLNMFAFILKRARHNFDVSFNLLWKPSIQEIQTAFQRINESYVKFGQFDGVLDGLRRTPHEYGRDIFASQMSLNVALHGQLITLLNYPRPSEKHVYFAVDTGQIFGLIFDNIYFQLDVDWVDLRTKLKSFAEYLWQTEANLLDIDAKLPELTDILDPLFSKGLRGIDIFDPKARTLQCRLGVKDRAVIGVEELFLPCCLLSCDTTLYPALRRVVLRTDDTDYITILTAIMLHNPGLLLLDIPTQAHELFDMIAKFGLIWLLFPRPFAITFYERDAERNGRLLAKVELRAPSKQDGYLVGFNQLAWMHSHVAQELDDWGAKVLDDATKHFSAILVSLRLNVSSLNEIGQARLQGTMRRSDLEQLFIECKPFDPLYSSRIGHVLGAIRWSFLMSLHLSGSNIDDWLQVWITLGNPFEPPPADQVVGKEKLERMQTTLSQTMKLKSLLPKHTRKQSVQPSNVLFFGCRLPCLIVLGTGIQQLLSHTSVVFIHRLVYSSPLVELSLVNVQFQNKADWDLVVDAIDFSLLVVLNLYRSNFHDTNVLFEKMGEQRSPLEDLELQCTPADEELRRQFRNY